MPTKKTTKTAKKPAAKKAVAKKPVAKKTVATKVAKRVVKKTAAVNPAARTFVHRAKVTAIFIIYFGAGLLLLTILTMLLSIWLKDNNGMGRFILTNVTAMSQYASPIYALLAAAGIAYTVAQGRKYGEPGIGYYVMELIGFLMILSPLVLTVFLMNY